MANLQDVIERMKAEGDLTRNSGTNSLKQTNRILGEVRTELVEIGKSLGAIRTAGGLGGGQVIQVVGGAGGGGGTASAATAPVSGGENNDPQTVVGLLGAAIRNQTVGRVERGAEAAKEFAAQKFKESALGKASAATQQFVGEKVEGTKEGLRGLAGLQTNEERDDLLRKSAEEENATRESIDRLVEVNTAMLGLSEDEAQNLRNRELEKADLGSGGTAAPTATMIGAGSGGGSGGGSRGGGGGSGDGAGKIGGTIGKFFGGIGGGLLAGFVQALGNPGLLKAAAIFALVLPLIGVGLAGFVAAIGAGFGLAAAAVGKGLEVLSEPLKGFSGSLKSFEDLDAQTLAEVGNGLGAFFDGLPGLGGMLVTVPEGLDGLADALVKMNEVNGDKLKVIGPAVEQMGKGLMAAGLGEVFSTISSALGGEGGGIEGQMTSLANGFRQFSDINADDVAKIGPAVRDLGLGLKAAGDSGGFGNALGGIVKGIGSFFGAEEEDPIEMFKRFSVLGQGEVGAQLETAGASLAGLGQGLSALNNLDTGNLGKFADDILPPLTKLTKAFGSETFQLQSVGEGNVVGSFVDGLSKMKDLEDLEGVKIKTNLEAIGEGLESFANDIEGKEIKNLANYVNQVARPLLALSGGGGGAGGAGGEAGEAAASGGAGTSRGGRGRGRGAPSVQNTGPDAVYTDPETGEIKLKTKQMIAQEALAQGPSTQALQKALYGGDVRKDLAMRKTVIENLKKQGYTDEQLSPEGLEQLTGKKGGGTISFGGKTYDSRAIGLYRNLKEEQERARMSPGGGRMNGAAMNGASGEIAAGQRQGGGNIVAPTDNSNNSTNVTNVNNGGGGGSPAPSPRRSQHRGGMYDVRNF